MGLLNIVKDMIKPITGMVDDLHTSEEEELKLNKQKLKLAA